MTDLTTRPTDERTAKVVAEWKGWTAAYIGVFVFTSADEPWKHQPNPRTDPFAALDLLHYLYLEHGLDVYWRNDGWGVHLGFEGGFRTIPISGPEMCYAVVNIAAEVLGVE
jgi:hypothetical protein